MNLSVSAVEGRIKRGKQRLRSRLAHRGVSMTACLVAVQSQPSGVSASEIESWSESVLQYGSDPNFFHASTFNSDPNHNLRKLVQGELQMKSFTSPPWLFWSGSVCLITIVGLGMLQVSNGGAPADQEQNRGTIIASEVSACRMKRLFCRWEAWEWVAWVWASGHGHGRECDRYRRMEKTNRRLHLSGWRNLRKAMRKLLCEKSLPS